MAATTKHRRECIRCGAGLPELCAWNRKYCDECKIVAEREQDNVRSKRWRKNRPESRAASTRRYYESHKEERMDWRREHRRKKAREWRVSEEKAELEASRTCEMCGASIAWSYPSTKYCEGCAVKAKKAADRRASKAGNVRQKALRKSDPEYKRRLYAKQRDRKFKLRPGEYDQILMSQGGKCAICMCTPEDAPKGVLYVDHDHELVEEYEPGEFRLRIRGLLCGRCNAMLGYARDSVTNLSRAISYISDHQQAALRVA